MAISLTWNRSLRGAHLVRVQGHTGSKAARQTTRSATAAALQRDAALQVAESTDLLWLDWRELTDYW